jgi:hypothetical protein
MREIMEKPSRVLPIVLFVFFAMATVAFSRTFYLNDATGNDSWSGTRPDSAWKTLAKPSATTFVTGDTLRLRAGGVWNGQLWPKGSGSQTKAIVIDSFGSGVRPRINGQGTSYPALHSGAVMFYDQSYWDINNLEVTNTSATVVSNRAGILFYAAHGLCNHCYVKICYVHDVNSDTTANGNKITGGIIFSGTNIDKDGASTGVNSGFVDALVEGCRVYNVSKEGIRNKSDNNGAYPRVNRAIVFRNNTVDRVWGDGIVLAECASGGLIERNVVANHSLTNSGYYAGIWTHYSTGTIVQYNEAYGAVAGMGDGEGFDCDNNCDGDIFQYNYSHNNAGGFMLLMPSATNCTFRYNISENDGKNGHLFNFSANNSLTNSYYNNVIYIGRNITTAIFNGTTTTRALQFTNNIIYCDGTITHFADGAWATGTNFRNNCFYPASIDDIGGPPSHPGLLTQNPGFVAPGRGDTGIAKVTGYILTAQSPCLNTGISVANNGGFDFYGNVLYTGTADIGVYERPTGTGIRFINGPSRSATNIVRDAGNNDQKVSWHYLLNGRNAANISAAMPVVVQDQPQGAGVYFKPYRKRLSPAK